MHWVPPTYMHAGIQDNKSSGVTIYYTPYTILPKKSGERQSAIVPFSPVLMNTHVRMMLAILPFVWWRDFIRGEEMINAYSMMFVAAELPCCNEGIPTQQYQVRTCTNYIFWGPSVEEVQRQAVPGRYLRYPHNELSPIHHHQSHVLSGTEERKNVPVLLYYCRIQNRNQRYWHTRYARCSPWVEELLLIHTIALRQSEWARLRYYKQVKPLP